MPCQRGSAGITFPRIPFPSRALNSSWPKEKKAGQSTLCEKKKHWDASYCQFAFTQSYSDSCSSSQLLALLTKSERVQHQMERQQLAIDFLTNPPLWFSTSWTCLAPQTPASSFLPSAPMLPEACLEDFSRNSNSLVRPLSPSPSHGYVRANSYNKALFHSAHRHIPSLMELSPMHKKCTLYSIGQMTMVSPVINIILNNDIFHLNT